MINHAEIEALAERLDYQKGRLFAMSAEAQLHGNDWEKRWAAALKEGAEEMDPSATALRALLAENRKQAVQYITLFGELEGFVEERDQARTDLSSAFEAGARAMREKAAQEADREVFRQRAKQIRSLDNSALEAVGFVANAIRAIDPASLKDKFYGRL